MTVWACKCPLGDQCSKKTSWLARKISLEEAKAAAAWHVQHSPYHLLSEEEARTLAEAAELESWEEDAWRWEETQADEGEAWYQRRKKAARKEAPAEKDRVEAAAFRMLQQRGMAATHSAGSAASSLMRVSGKGQPTDHIMLYRVQMQACIDSLKRAKSAAESACHLCSKAARAFGEEAACIQSCQDVLQSYLD